MKFTLMHGAIIGMGGVATVIATEMWYSSFQAYMDSIYPHFFATLIIALIESMIVVGFYKGMQRTEKKIKSSNEERPNLSNFLRELTKKRLLIVVVIVISSVILGYFAPNPSLGQNEIKTTCISNKGSQTITLYPISFPQNSSLQSEIFSVTLTLNTTDVFQGDTVGFHAQIGQSGLVFPQSDNQITLFLTNDPNSQIIYEKKNRTNWFHVPYSTDTIDVTQFYGQGLDGYSMNQQNQIFLDHRSTSKDANHTFEADGIIRFPVETTVYVSGGIEETDVGVTKLSPQFLFKVQPSHERPPPCYSNQ